MKDRRLKIGLISMHVASSWGKDLGAKIKDIIPEDAIVLKQNEDMLRASVALLIYHKSFDDVPEGEEIPQTILSIPLKEKGEKSTVIYPH